MTLLNNYVERYKFYMVNSIVKSNHGTGEKISLEMLDNRHSASKIRLTFILESDFQEKTYHISEEKFK